MRARYLAEDAGKIALGCFYIAVDTDALIAAERLFLHTFAMDGTVHKQMQAAIASATGEAA